MADDSPKQVYVKTPQGFVPVSDPARTFHAKARLGAEVQLDGKMPRNLKRHRRFWSLMSWACENAEGFETPEQVCHTVKVLMGYCDFVPDGVGGLVAVPRSISFSAMDEIAFDAFDRGAVGAVLKLLPAGCDENTIMEALAYA